MMMLRVAFVFLVVYTAAGFSFLLTAVQFSSDQIRIERRRGEMRSPPPAKKSTTSRLMFADTTPHSKRDGQRERRN